MNLKKRKLPVWKKCILWNNYWKKNSIKNEKFNLEIFIGGGSSQSNYKYYNKQEQRIFAISTFKRKFNKSGEELPYRGGLMLTYKL